MKLNDKYKQEDFIGFIEDLLPEDFIVKEEDIIIKKDRYKEITKAKILGFCKSLDLYVLEMDHTHDKDRRIAITTDAFKILADHWIHKALVVFKNNDSENYRLSFLTITLDQDPNNKITKKYSNARRYSFYLGPNASINTPNKFLINQGKVSDIEDLVSRFSVEIVTEEFFENYKNTFFNICDEFNKNTVFKSEVILKYDIKTSDFVKKLMGQIVFLYFLQRKGWIGVNISEKWGDGDPRFMRNIFNLCIQQNKNYYNDYLEPLFYDYLGKANRGNNTVTNDQSFASLFNSRIPYLNGGLFESIYDWKNTKIEISNDVFDKLLSFLDLYNFTVDENTPSDQEVSVDPEMLGKIFENLLEIKDRKSTGSYYTPREIVHYMCRESLINYLFSESEIPEERLRKLFNSKDTDFSITLTEDIISKNPKLIELKEIADKVDSLLRKIKIIDPAVGSGAFPMGMLSEISSTRYYLNNNFLHKVNVQGAPLSMYDIKRETLENCIYGVDLDPGAIDIAKLRFWLALVVDHNIEEIEALPNLDYKIMQGNSLLEDLIIGESIIPLKFDTLSSVNLRSKNTQNVIREANQFKLFIDESDNVLEDIRILQAKYFKESNSSDKKELKNLIEIKEYSLINSKCKEEIERLNTIIKNSIREEEKQEANDQILQISKTSDILFKERTKPYFLWHLNFYEVFEKGGFDIVIGNPPYVTTKDGKIEPYLKKAYLNNFETAYDKLDLYVLFFEQAIKIAKVNGIITYITPWNFLANFYSFKIRKYLLDNVKIKIFTKLPPNTFKGIIVDNIISVFQKNKNNKNNQILFDNIFDKSQQKYLEQDNYLSNDKYLFDFPRENTIDEILLKMKKDSVTLGSIALNYIGIMTGGQKEMISDSPIFDNSKPVLSGKDVFKWFLVDRGNYVNFDRKKIHSNDNEKVYLSDKKILLRKTGRELTACLDTDKFYSIQSLYNIVVKDKEYIEEYLLALLNSKLFTYIYNQFFITNPEVFPYIKRRNLDQFPIKKISNSEQKEFIDLVNKILDITKNDNYLENTEKQIEVKNIEHQIDERVYSLYNLNPEEIKIIENFIK